jgi:hypothetical protein
MTGNLRNRAVISLAFLWLPAVRADSRERLMRWGTLMLLAAQILSISLPLLALSRPSRAGAAIPLSPS